MRYYPVFLDLKDRDVVFSGAGSAAEAKIRLLLKTPARIAVYGENPSPALRQWAGEGRITLAERAIDWDDVSNARLVYGANGDRELDRRAVELGRWAGALTNIVDNLEESEFLTPAIVDRDPVTVAIGTEGTAPVLARRIKASVETLLPQSTGPLARIAEKFRPAVAELSSKARRTLWGRFFDRDGALAFEAGGKAAATDALQRLMAADDGEKPAGSVCLVGAGPGDPELLTLKARKRLDEADVVLYDHLVAPQVLELARREAKLVSVGKKGFARSWAQADIEAEMIAQARKGRHVVRLKGGDPAIFGRLGEEIEALAAAGIAYEVVPGITAAAAAAAAAGQSLTKRGHNSAIRFMTGHDTQGFAEQDWAGLARPGAAAAIYMGAKAAPFIAGRLLMHGASRAMPVTIVVNASRPGQQIIRSDLGRLPAAIGAAEGQGPALLLLGLAPAAGAVGGLTQAEQTEIHLRSGAA